MDRAAIDKAYDPSLVEPPWVQRWLDAGSFAPRPASADAPGARPYVVLLPPPNVTGVLHMGHVLANTLQDVFIRYARMQGLETVWWPGTDHAGIATQKVVEKNLRKDGIDPAALGRDKFVEQCWAWKAKSHAHIVQQMQRLGWSLDWQREYFTLDDHMSRAVLEVFIRLYNKGLIYKGAYITNWCPACRTAISDEEVEHVEKQGHIWTLRYPFADGSGFVRVATTRPETILGDVAVAIHPDDPRAQDLVGRMLRLPVLGREIPVIADTYVDPAFGTGMVKITPAHDPNDFHVGQRHHLESPIVIDPAGKMNDKAGPYAGLDRFEARKRIVAQLESEGLLDKIEPHTLAIGRHDRCETIIEPYLSQQWFVKMKPLAEPAVRAAEDGRVTFYPERWRNVYLHWTRNIQDWCISRQLWWGHRIPVYECGACGHAVAAHTAPARCEKCGDARITQDESVLDTWFSSWLCPLSPLGWPDEDAADFRRYHPTTLLVTGYEIIFFWVARMIMASLEFTGQVPFSQVLLNGIVRDAKGRKLSKSLGNSPDPLDLIAKYGADAVRFSTVMLSPPGQDTFFDAKNVETGQFFANKIWNAARLVLTSADSKGFVAELGLETAAPAAAPAPDASGAASGLEALWAETFARPLPAGVADGLRLEDRWVLHRYTDAVAAVHRDLTSLRANDAASTVYHFFWDEYCAWYLESIKPRLQGEDRATARTAHAVALVLLASASRLLAPLMPFLAEELWSRVPGTAGMVTTARFPREIPALRDAASMDRFALVTETASAIRTVRSERNVPPGKKAPALVQKDTLAAVGWDSEQGALLRLHAKLESLEPCGGRPDGAIALLVRDLQLYLPLEGLLDLGAERERLQKEFDKLDRDLVALDAKLAKPGFVDKAPPAVVDGERARRVELVGRRDRLRMEIAAITGKGP